MAIVAMVTSWTAWSSWTSWEARDKTWVAQLPYLVKKNNNNNKNKPKTNAVLNCDCTWDHCQSEEWISVEYRYYLNLNVNQVKTVTLVQGCDPWTCPSKDSRREDLLTFVFTLFMCVYEGFTLPCTSCCTSTGLVMHTWTHKSSNVFLPFFCVF